MLCRFDSAYYGHGPVSAALKAGAQVSVTVRMDPAVKRAIATIPETAWETIHYTDAILDEATGVLVSSAEESRNWLHRVHLPQESRTGSRAPGGAPDPGTEPEEGRRARHPL